MYAHSIKKVSVALSLLFISLPGQAGSWAVRDITLGMDIHEAADKAGVIRTSISQSADNGVSGFNLKQDIKSNNSYDLLSVAAVDEKVASITIDKQYYPVLISEDVVLEKLKTKFGAPDIINKKHKQHNASKTVTYVCWGDCNIIQPNKYSTAKFTLPGTGQYVTAEITTRGYKLEAADQDLVRVSYNRLQKKLALAYQESLNASKENERNFDLGL